MSTFKPINWRRDALLVSVVCFSFAAWLVWGPPHVMQGVDYGLTHHFYKLYLHDAFWAGEVPFWNPYTSLGRPFLADPEVAAFYPATWLFLFLPEDVAFWIGVGLHFFIGASGFIRLAMKWGAARTAAYTGGIAFIITPPVLGHLQGGMFPYICVLAWWPWLLSVTDTLCTCPSRRVVLLLTGLLAAAFLAGHPHAFWLCGCSLGFFVLARTGYGGMRDSLKRLISSYGLLGLAAIGSFAICAIQFLPLLELAAESNRSGASRNFAAAWSLKWEGLASLFRVVLPNRTDWWDGNLYVGLPLLALGMCALFRLSDPRMRALLFMGLACLGLALGFNAPVFSVLYSFVPAIGSFRTPSRFAMFVDFALILGAVCWWREPNLRSRKVFIVAMGASLLVGCARLSGERLVTIGALCAIAAMAMTIASLLLWLRGWLHLAATVWLVASLVDLTPVAVTLGSVFKIPTASGRRQLPDDIVKLTKTRTTNKEPPRVFIPPYLLRANSGMENHYSLVAGNVALGLGRTWYYLHLATGTAASPLQVTYLDPDVFATGPFPYAGMNILLGYDTRRQALLLNHDAGNRAWLTQDIQSVANANGALKALLDKSDPVKTVILEQPVPEINKIPRIDLISARAEITAFSRNRVELQVKNSGDAILVLSEAWFPGWTATVGGNSTEVYPANLWMRAVFVPSGEHRVIFAFHSTYFPIGCLISAAALITWIMAWRKSKQLIVDPLNGPVYSVGETVE